MKGFSATQDLPKVAVIVPTLNRRSTLVPLLESLRIQNCEYVSIVVVNQGPPLRESVLAIKVGKASVTEIRCLPGLSRARNTGLRAIAHQPWEIVALLDDDVVCEEGAFQAAITLTRAGASAVSPMVWSRGGVNSGRVRETSGPIVLNRRSVWRHSLEAACFLTPSFVEIVGYYDEALGLGSNTPWQSGEGTDLFLRGFKLGQIAVFCPGSRFEEEPLPPLSDVDYQARLRKYARGTGRVYATQTGFNEKLTMLGRTTIRTLLALRSKRSASFAAQVAIGRIEGLLGVTTRWLA